MLGLFFVGSNFKSVAQKSAHMALAQTFKTLLSLSPLTFLNQRGSLPILSNYFSVDLISFCHAINYGIPPNLSAPHDYKLRAVVSVLNILETNFCVAYTIEERVRIERKWELPVSEGWERESWPLWFHSSREIPIWESKVLSPIFFSIIFLVLGVLFCFRINWTKE